jgi:hypothetical protein
VNRESASIDPDDPASPHYHEEEEDESFEPLARPSDNGAPRVPQSQGSERDPDTSTDSGHDPQH